MTLNQRVIDLVHTPNAWYSTTVEYVGKAYVRFSKPKGWIRGKAKCKYDSLGNGVIKMEVKEWENEEAPSGLDKNVSFTWLAAGYRPDGVASGMLMLGSVTNTNLCDFIEIKTKNGTYRAEKPNYDWPAFRHEFEFYPREANFQVTGKTREEAKYWVLPLLNFLTLFLDRYDNFQNHPLRIFPIRPEVFEFLESDASAIEKRYVEHQATASSYLIGFMYNDQPGFIEPVPKYRKYVKDIESGKLRNAQTAVMVGSAKNLKNELDPIELLPVLGITTGHLIGASWYELRDESSHLLSRFHANFGGSDYGYGRAAIDSRLQKGGIGDLLTQASKSPHYGGSQMRAVMRNLSGSLSGHDVSTMLFYVCAALDVLYSYLVPNPLTVQLLPVRKKEIEKILDDARIKILQIENKLSWETKEEKEEGEALKTIANKVRSQPLNSRVVFEDKVIALLSFFEFEDQAVMNRYFTSLGLEPSGWKEMIKHYRNRTMHYAYYPEKTFFLPEDKSEQEIATILFHLHDILLRCVLKLLEYEGEYYASTLPFHPKPVDWVKGDISPELLGYKS